jgi:hypothetical protein
LIERALDEARSQEFKPQRLAPLRKSVQKDESPNVDPRGSHPQ